MRNFLPPPLSAPPKRRQWLLLALLLLLMRPAAAWAQLQPGLCQYNSTIDLGKLGETTHIYGDYTFPVGNHHVVGDLYFTKGTLTIHPGTTFYLEGQYITKPGTGPVSKGTWLQARRRLTLSVRQLRPGQYAARLYVDQEPVAVQRIVIQP